MPVTNVGLVIVSVMLVVPMRVGVGERFMGVRVLVHFGQVEPDTEEHQGTRNRQAQSDRFVEDQDGEQRPDERCCRKVGSRPGRADFPKRGDEERKAHPVARQA